MRWLLLGLSCLLPYCGDVARSAQQDQSEQHEVAVKEDKPLSCVVLPETVATSMNNYFKLEGAQSSQRLFGLWYRHGFTVTNRRYACGAGCDLPECNED